MIQVYSDGLLDSLEWSPSASTFQCASVPVLCGLVVDTLIGRKTAKSAVWAAKRPRWIWLRGLRELQSRINLIGLDTHEDGIARVSREEQKFWYRWSARDRDPGAIAVAKKRIW